MPVILDALFFILLSTLAHVVPLGAIGVSEDRRAERRISSDLYDSLNELAHILDVSYCIGNTGIQRPFQCLSHCRELKDFELVTTWHTGLLLSDSCGFITLSHASSPKRIIVAFRGTTSLANVIIDLSSYPQEYVPYIIGNDTDGGNHDKQPECIDCYVHAGFMKAWRNTRSEILETISAVRDQYSDYKLELVGYSLGGAVAALAGAEMQLRGWDPLVTTLGEPRVGNTAFNEFLNALFQLNVDDVDAWKLRKVTHAYDPITLLPPSAWGYEMHAGEIYISRVDLPFSVADVIYCRGAYDEECISGDETSASRLRPLLHQIKSLGDGTEQQILSESTDSPLTSNLHSAHRMPWDPIPVRFRAWEIFHSHRDYFLRLWLCMPEGDPSGERWRWPWTIF
ncbi:Alpha/Beta hydrolase protein [Aspergillus californicus]